MPWMVSCLLLACTLLFLGAHHVERIDVWRLPDQLPFRAHSGSLSLQCTIVHSWYGAGGEGAAENPGGGEGEEILVALISG